MYQPGPFLICVPLSTLVHWQREFISWTGLNTIVYHGSAEDRKKIREHEFAFEKDRPDNPGWGVNSLYLKKCEPAKKGSAGYTQWMASVVITTPEMLVADDWTELSYVKWSVLVVDEVCYSTILHYYLLLMLISCFAFPSYCTRHRLLNHIPSYSNTYRFFISLFLYYHTPSHHTIRYRPFIRTPFDWLIDRCDCLYYLHTSTLWIHSFNVTIYYKKGTST